MSILKISRLEGLTDGVFAIAMTILILDLRLEKGLPPEAVSQFLLSDILYKLAIYIGSFIILGTLWIAMHFQLGLLRRINRTYLWANVFYLMTICVVPFSASLVANYPENIACLNFFAINLLCASFGQLLISQCAHYFHLNGGSYNKTIRLAVVKRILVAPIFYVAALFVAHWNTHWAFFILVLPILSYIIPGKVDRLESELEEE